MNRLPPELLYCIADLLKPSGAFLVAPRDMDPGHDLLSLIKACRRFYQLLVGVYYRALIAQLGLANCFQRAALKNSARAMELIRDNAGDSFPMPNDQMYIWLETSLRFRGGYEPFSWLLAMHKEMQFNVIKVKKSMLLYTALRSTNERILRHLFDEADEEDIHTVDGWTDETLLMAAVRRRQSKGIIRYLLRRGIEIAEMAPGVRQTALDVAIEVNWLYAIEVFIEYNRQLVNELLWEGLAYMPLLKGMFEIQSNPDVAFDGDYIFRFAVMIFDHAPDENRFQTAFWGNEVLTRAIAGRHWRLAQRVIQHGMGIDFSDPNNDSLVTSIIRYIKPDEPDENDGVTTLKMLLDQGVPIGLGHIDVNSLLPFTSSGPVIKLLINHQYRLPRE